MDERLEETHTELREGSIRSSSFRRPLTYLEAGDASGAVSATVLTGWISKPRTLQTCVSALAENHDRHAISFDLNGSVKHWKTGNENDEEPLVFQRQAEVLIEGLEAKGISQTDLIAPSAAAITAMIAVRRRPDLFRNVIFVNPAGTVENDSLWKAMGRYRQEGKEYTQHRNDAVGKTTETIRSAAEYTLAFDDAKEYMRENPWAALQVGRQATRYDLGQVLSETKQDSRYSHIGFGFIHSDQDIIYSMEDVKKAAKKAGIPPEHFIEIAGFHVAHLDRQEELADLSQELIGRLEAVKQRKKLQDVI